MIQVKDWMRRPVRMARTLSNDLRKRVVEAVEGGMSRRAAALKYDVGEASAIRWVARYRRTGSWEPDKRGSRERRSPLDDYRDEILALVGKKADITLNEIVDYLRETHGVETSKSSVDRFFARHDVTFKKDGARQRASARGRKGEAGGLVRRPAGA